MASDLGAVLTRARRCEEMRNIYRDYSDSTLGKRARDEALFEAGFYRGDVEALVAQITRLQAALTLADAALESIAALGDVDSDEAPLMAQRALAKLEDGTHDAD